MFRRIGRIATICALCCAIGLHWIALQSIAWTTMIVSYAKQQSVCIAIVQTFDGAHPCSLCHAISKGKTSEKKTDVRSLTPKIDLICGARAIRVLPLFAPFDYGTCSFSSSKIGHSPPVPPPRFQVS